MDRRTFLKTTGVAAGAAGVGLGTSQLYPDRTHAEVTAAQLEGDVELLTDEYGVSHVYASDIYAAGYGQGYAQARDRLFQMDLLRTTGRGTSASVIGPSQLGSDISVKQGLYNEAELQHQWENANPDTRQMIQGYTDGVNARMAKMEAAGELPGEFALLGRNPPAWKPTDTVAVITYTIGRFGVTGGGELGNADTLTDMFERFESEERAWDAYQDLNKIVVPENHYGSLRADADGVRQTEERTLDYEEVPDEQLDAIRAARNTESWGTDEDSFDGIPDVFLSATGIFEGLQFGSNAIIVGGEHTDTGKPMLGGGPQMGLFKPPIIHEIGLHTEEFNVAGVGVVGTPGIVVGRTNDFAWTVTTGGDDMRDTIAVNLNPNDRSQYEWDGEFYDFVIEEYTHRPNLWAGLVFGGLDTERVTQKVAYADFVREDGDLRPLEENDVGQRDVRMPVDSYNPEEDVAFLKRTATRMNEVEGAFMWANIGRSNDREGFEESLSQFPFTFNFHYIDDEDIAYYRSGKLPIRNESEVDPRFPTPQEYHDWEGFRVGADRPEREDPDGIGASALNPERGYVVNWNNAPGTGWRNGDGEFAWDGIQRVEILDRLTKEFILDTDEDLSLDDFENARLPEDASGRLELEDVEKIIEKASVEQPFAPHVVPHIVAAARASDDTQLQAMADELEAWAEAENIEQWTEPDTLERWTETVYSYRPGEDGHYTNGGMAIYEEIRHELAALMFEETLGGGPRPAFDPTAGGGVGGGPDPHAADHGTGGGTSVFLLANALEGRTNFEWLADHGDQFQLVNEATGQAMALDTGSSWWEWLWAEDEIRQRPPEDSVDQVWQVRDDSGNPTFTEGEPRELRAQTGAYAAGLDGPASEQGARVSPTTPADDPQRFEFRSVDGGGADGGTYRVCNADSGLALAATKDGDICQEPLAETPRQRWTVQFAQSSGSQNAIIREAMQNAAETLTERYGSESPGEWLLDNRKSEFFPLGGTKPVTIPMTNRASYQQSIAMKEGADIAQSVLPPANTGHVDTWTLLEIQLGDRPDRLRTQVSLYENFKYKPHPILREQVENERTDTTKLG
jgi:acyl-homoserine lactone acylase PvdQ